MLVLVVAAMPYAAVVGPTAMRRAAAPRAVLAGAVMFGAYVLALAALELAEAAPVAALRETSVVMAAMGAAVGGRSRVPVARVLGAWWSWRGLPRSLWGSAGVGNGAG